MPTAVAIELTRSSDELVDRFAGLQTRADVAELLEIPYGHLNYILYRGRGSFPYRKFQIPKRAGGVREISAPTGSMLILQRKLHGILQLVYRPRPSVQGFVPERSILTNALEHASKRFVFNIDLEDFFPSINFGRVLGLFKARPYEVGEEAAVTLAQLCCEDNQLPQGAPTSPVVANMICGRLDRDLQHLAASLRCTYTRYADDITFSTRLSDFPPKLAVPRGGSGTSAVTLGEELAQAVESNGFKINLEKVRLQYRSCHQEVTGLTVNKFPNVKRRFVRQVRAMLNAWKKHGYEAAEREFHEKYDQRHRDPSHPPVSFARVIKGKLDFLKMVKGENDAAYRKLAAQLHALEPALIKAPVPLEAEPPTTFEPQAATTAQDLRIEPPISMGGADQTWQTLYQRYKDLVFHSETKRPGFSPMGGTTFYWMRDVLATAAHNLAGELFVSPPLAEDQPVTDFVEHDLARSGVDVALLRLPSGTLHQKRFPVRFELPDPGEQLAALGFPAIPRRQPTLGIYPGTVESVATDYSGQVYSIQVTIELAGGISGGPVIDRAGNLVGLAMEQTFNRPRRRAKDDDDEDDIPPERSFRHVLPVRYLMQLSSRTRQQ